MDTIFYMTNKDSVINIKLPDSMDKPSYMVRVAPYMHPFTDDKLTIHPYFKVDRVGNMLSFNYTFNYEDEYVIFVHEVDAPETKVEYYYESKPLLRETIYALNEDLYYKNILKVDFHAHSTASDGAFSPEIVCSYYREGGFDVFALTDHFTMDGSVKAKEFYKDVDMDMKLYYGEETHPVGSEPHIVNWGCDRSVNAILYGDKEKYERELDDIIKECNLSKYLSARTIANCIWRCRKIAECGGMSIFAHPYWKYVVNTVEQEVIDYMFSHKVADVFELCGGNTVHDNNLQINYYMDYLRKGYDIAIVGDSDSHSDSTYFLEEFTIVFADSDKKEDIMKAVKDRYTIVYEKNKADTEPRLYSDFRFVPLGHFLLNNYFPVLKTQYEMEGKLMKRIADGDKTAIKELKKEKGKIEKLKKSLYCKY